MQKELNIEEITYLDSIEILKDSKNEFAQSVILQYQRGAIISPGQQVHLIRLAQNHIRSLQRGFTGIDHNKNSNTAKVKAEKEKIVTYRYKSKYRKLDIKDLLTELNVTLIQNKEYPNTHYSILDNVTGEILEYEFKTIKDFVVWATDNDPAHPLANGIKN